MMKQRSNSACCCEGCALPESFLRIQFRFCNSIHSLARFDRVRSRPVLRVLGQQETEAETKADASVAQYASHVSHEMSEFMFGNAVPCTDRAVHSFRISFDIMRIRFDICVPSAVASVGSI